MSEEDYLELELINFGGDWRRAAEYVLKLPVPYMLRMLGNGTWVAEWNPTVKSLGLPPSVKATSNSNPLVAVVRLREALIEEGVIVSTVTSLQEQS